MQSPANLLWGATTAKYLRCFPGQLYASSERTCLAAAGLFSATQTDAFNALARAGLRNPVRVNVAVSAASQPAPVAAPALPSTTDMLSANCNASTSRAGEVESAPDASKASQGLQQRTPASLSITYMQCEADQKLGQLIRFLQVRCSAFCAFYAELAMLMQCRAIMQVCCLLRFAFHPEICTSNVYGILQAWD